MGGSRMAVLCVGLGALGFGCTAPPGMDLATNPALYRHTGYRAKVQADRTVFVAPVVDERGPRAAEASEQYTVHYFADGQWQRSPAQMVDDVIREEIAESAVFAAVSEQARPEDCVLRVRLTHFDVGGETHVTGWRSFATVGLEVEVLGPQDPGGSRPQWMVKDFVEHRRSEIDWRPPSASALTGSSLRVAIARMLAALDQSNVGRSNVPLDVH